MVRDLYEKQATVVGDLKQSLDVTSKGFARDMMEMKEFVKAQRTYNVSLTYRHPQPSRHGLAMVSLFYG
jgi:hypothetical protein